MATCKEFTATKTVEEFIGYAKAFSEKPFANKEDVQKCVDKLVSMSEAYGFKFNRSFNASCRPMLSGENTCNFYRLQTSEYGYIELQIGFIYDYKHYASKWNGRKRVTPKPTKLETVKGVFRSSDCRNPDLNPQTGRPWQVGDYDPSGYGRTLTRNGWYTGD